MDNASNEIALNLWLLIDEAVGYGYALMGRAYMLDGSDEEKIRKLHELARTDHALANRHRVPANYKVVDPAGNTREHLIDPNFAFSSEQIPFVFGSVIKEIENELPPQVTWVDGEVVLAPRVIPQDPIMVCTGLLEHADGRITALSKPLTSDTTVVSPPPTVEPVQRKSHTVVLREKRSEEDGEFSILTAYIDKDGSLVLDGYDIGDSVMKAWGDSDYEYWRRVRPEFLDIILLELLKECFDSDVKFHNWLLERGIPDEFNSWA
jgi:hypothetical protein